jgi:hypothetical protein
MAIVVPIDNDKPFSQGDILKGVKLFSTAKPWDGGGQHVTTEGDICLVVSRPCNCEPGQSKTAVVVYVSKSQVDIPRALLKPPELEKDDAHKGKGKEKESDSCRFLHAVKFLEKHRDGHGSPDLLYLGQLPKVPGRYGARLDSFHTIQIPQEEKSLAEFVQRFRIGRLHDDFIRDLHSRIFGAFASLGFDKCGWYTDADLKLVVQLIKADVAAAKYRVESFGVFKAQWEAAGDSSKKQPELELAKKDLADLESQAAPFLTEFERRNLSEDAVPGQPVKPPLEPAVG